jgi:hypothetical protein
MVLAMVYNPQNHWGSALCSSSVILNKWNTAFQKLDLFLSSDEGRTTPTLLSPLERAKLTGQPTSHNNSHTGI